jgi:sec-independent protein translocase protein TatA
VPAEGRKAHLALVKAAALGHLICGAAFPLRGRGIEEDVNMQMGPWQLLLIAVVVLVLFGRGKVSSLMGEVGKGITAFKRGVKDSTDELEQDKAAPVTAARDVTPSETDKV